ncbi:MAG: CoA transferase [Chloroflexi bacterium]|nr:CoA transferase [Chloroflexota bacterium]
MPDDALSGLLVLDLSHGISGAYCTRLLAGLGAEVIKVEAPGGDEARRMGPFPTDIPDLEQSGLFLYLNTGKKSVTLDLSSATGISILKALVKATDILVEGYAPSVLPGLGVGYDSLEFINPALIMTSISYFGQTGPYRDYQGSDLVALALGGLMDVTGEPDREPLKPGGFQAEYQAGINAAVATMTALYYRDETGLGQHIDVSVVECIASITEGATLSYAYNKVLRRREGSRHHTACPSVILPCRDGYVHIHAPADWDAFARFVGAPRLMNSEFKASPRRHADEIEAILMDWVKDKTRDEVFHAAQEWRLPFAKVMGIDELFDDPQYLARAFFVDVEDPQAGVLRQPSAPFRMSTPWQAGRAPLLGEHNEEVYCQGLGYSREDLVRLRERGVV